MPTDDHDFDLAELDAAFAPRFDFEGELVYGPPIYGDPGPPFVIEPPAILTAPADGDHPDIHGEAEA